MVGAGHQSAFQLRAAAQQRAFEKVVAWNPHPDMLPRLEAARRDLGLPFEAVSQQELGAQADVIVTITSRLRAALMRGWIKPGHARRLHGHRHQGQAGGRGRAGRAATVFTDEVAQSVQLGEAQHAVAQGLLDADQITPIGAVINADHPGRRSADEITLFDGTGVGLQDLAVAATAADRAAKQGPPPRRLRFRAQTRALEGRLSLSSSWI